MSGERPEEPDLDPSPAEPSAGDVEALVRSIEAKEAAAGADPAGPTAASNGSAIPDGPVARPAALVVSSSAAARRPATTATISGSVVPVERRHAGRSGVSRQAVGRGGTGRAIAGLIGRLEWERLVADESERQRRYGRPSAIVLVELAGLDRVTARTRPGVIGRVVPPCAETLVAMARASDRVTRLRDGRFGILLRETDANGASRYAARTVAACDPWLASLPWPLHLAVGWASPDGGEDLVGAVRQAERRLQVSAAKATATGERL